MTLRRWRAGVADTGGDSVAKVAGEGGEGAMRFRILILMELTKHVGLIEARRFEGQATAKERWCSILGGVCSIQCSVFKDGRAAERGNF